MTDVSSEIKSVVLVRVGNVDGVMAVTASVTISEGFVWKVEVHGQIVPPEHYGSPSNTLSAVSRVITMVESQEICCGNPDESFFPLAEAKFMDSSDMCVCMPFGI